MYLVGGLLLLHSLILLVGSSCLYAAKIVDFRPGELLRAVGFAHLTGVALLTLSAIFLLVAGGTLDRSVSVVFAGALSAVFFLFGKARRRGGDAAVTESFPVARSSYLGTLSVGGLIALFVLLGIWFSRRIGTAWDAAHNWTFKAVTLYDHGSLIPNVFENHRMFGTSHLDYPILQPTLSALTFNFTGRASQTLIAFELWLLLLAFVGAAVFLLGSRLPALALAPIGLAVISQNSLGILNGDADVTVAIFFAIGILAIARSFDRDEPRLLIPAVLLLGAAANTKNEGFAFCLALVPVLLLVAIGRSKRVFFQTVGALSGVVMLIVPWRLWVSQHGPFPVDYTSPGEALSWSFLTARLDSLDTGANGLLAAVSAHENAYLLFSIFFGYCLVRLLLRPRRQLGTLYLYSFGALAIFATILWVYWTSPQPDLAGHVQRTASRLMSTPLFVVAVGFAQLLAADLRSSSDRETVSSDRAVRGVEVQSEEFFTDGQGFALEGPSQGPDGSGVVSRPGN